MANLKAIKNRISSVKATEKITKAMKMVATAKFKKMKDALQYTNSYLEELESIKNNILSRLSEEEANILLSHNLLKHYPASANNYHLIVLNTSNKGLCGSVNNYNFKLLKSFVSSLEAKNHKIIIYAIGKKGYDFCLSRYPNYLYNKQPVIIDEKTQFNLHATQEDLLKILKNHTVSASSIIYANFITSTSQEAKLEHLTPIGSGRASNKTEYLLDVSKTKLAIDVVEQLFVAKILFALISNATSEQSARMLAMDGATTNASKAIKGLTLLYNRVRQANITREISEIVSGVESCSQNAS